jgi:hypothetical protein
MIYTNNYSAGQNELSVGIVFDRRLVPGSGMINIRDSENNIVGSISADNLGVDFSLSLFTDEPTIDYVNNNVFTASPSEHSIEIGFDRRVLPGKVTPLGGRINVRDASNNIIGSIEPDDAAVIYDIRIV